MKEHIKTQIEEMKKQTIGVEVEMNSIRRDRAAKIAAEFFGTMRYENTDYCNGYKTWSAWDGEGREWKFQKDVSILGPDNEKCELDADPYLSRYGNLAGTFTKTSEGGCEKRRNARMRCSHPHRRKGAHTADDAKPCQHHGKPRKPSSRCS